MAYLTEIHRIAELLVVGIHAVHGFLFVGRRKREGEDGKEQASKRKGADEKKQAGKR